MSFLRSGLVSASLLSFSLLALVGCPAPVGVSGAVHVPRDSANVCAGQCESIGLTLSSVVVMANNVGCVCAANMVFQPPMAAPPVPAGPPSQSPAVPPAPPAAPATSQAQSAGAAAGGMAAILMAEEAEQRRASSNNN